MNNVLGTKTRLTEYFVQLVQEKKQSVKQNWYGEDWPDWDNDWDNSWDNSHGDNPWEDWNEWSDWNNS